MNLSRSQLFGIVAVIAIVLVVYTVLVNVSNGRKITKALDAVVITVTIDGCEYLKIEPNATGLTHKGNCTNAIHARPSQSNP